MKLPDYSVPGGQANLDFGLHSHNMPAEPPVFNPGTPTRVPTYPKSKAAEHKMSKIRHEFAEGELNIGKSDKKVTDRKQMLAIMLHEGEKAEKKHKSRK